MRLHKIFFIISILLPSSCGNNSSAPFNNLAFDLDSKNYLYVVSGPCYAGGVVTSTGPANTVSRFDLESGALEGVVIDYNVLAPGDSPVAIAEYNGSNILVLVENTAGRRIDLVRKDGTGYSTYLVNSAALTTAGRSLEFLADSSVLLSKSVAIEKFNSAKARVTQGANPFVNAPAGTCATSTTLISSHVTHSNGRIIYTHAAATPNNRIGVISASGYAAPADCLSSLAGPTTLALPTRALLHKSGKLIVSYASTTAASNFVYSYDFNTTTGALSNPVSIYNNNSIVNGPSAMAEDRKTGNIFIANANATFNTIEKFRYSNNVLSRFGTSTFIPYGIYTRCVSDMKVFR